MSTVATPGIAMLLVLANIVLCLSVERQRHTGTPSQSGVTVFSAGPTLRAGRDARNRPSAIKRSPRKRAIQGD